MQVLCRDTRCVDIFNVSDFNMFECHFIILSDPFDGTRAKSIESGLYCSLLAGHAIRVTSILFHHLLLLLLLLLTSQLLSSTSNLFSIFFSTADTTHPPKVFRTPKVKNALFL